MESYKSTGKSVSRTEISVVKMLIRNNTGMGEVSISDMDFIGTFLRMVAAENTNPKHHKQLFETVCL